MVLVSISKIDTTLSVPKTNKGPRFLAGVSLTEKFVFACPIEAT